MIFIRKIFIVISAVILSLSVSFIFCHAEDSLIPLDPGSVYTFSYSVPTSVTMDSILLSAGQSLVPLSSSGNTVAIDLNQNRYIFGFAFNLSEDGSTISFEPDYTYSITVDYQLLTYHLTAQYLTSPLEPLSYYIGDFQLNGYGTLYSAGGVNSWLDLDTLESSFASQNSVVNESGSDMIWSTYTYSTDIVFRVPSDSSISGQYISIPFIHDYTDYNIYPQAGTSNYSCRAKLDNVSIVAYYDPTGSIIEEEIDRVESAVQAAAEQAHEDAEALQGLISGDGSFGSPESSYGDDIDDYLSAESDLLDQVGFDSLYTPDHIEVLFDPAEWGDIDVPTRRAMDWFNLTVNPIFYTFPVLIIFPVFIGFVATILSRRAK